MSEWFEITIKDLCLKITDGSHYSPASVMAGYPMLSVKDMDEYGFNFLNARLISKDDYDRLVKADCKPLKDDVLIAKDGSYLKHVFVIKEESDVVILSSIAILRPNVSIINPYFLKHLLKAQAVRSSMSNYVTGSALPRIILSDFKKMKLCIPSLPTQTRIADILSAYDDAIENNNHRIALLEKAARELYQEWFVRFRFPGHKKAKFVNGLPEGWEVKRLEKISDFRYGTMPNAEHIRETGFPIFSGYRITGYYKDWMFENEQLVLIARGVGGTGEVRISPPFCYLTNLAIAFLLKTDVYKFYLYEMFQLQNLRHLDTGAAQSQITIENLKRYKVIIPTIDLLNEYDQIVKNIYNLKLNLQSRSQNVARQRDLLLPRLMSGKLNV